MRMPICLRLGGLGLAKATAMATTRMRAAALEALWREWRSMEDS